MERGGEEGAEGKMVERGEGKKRVRGWRKKGKRRREEDGGEGRRIRWRGMEMKTWKGDEGKMVVEGRRRK